jgi:hypothetical protein
MTRTCFQTLKQLLLGVADLNLSLSHVSEDGVLVVVVSDVALNDEERNLMHSAVLLVCMDTTVFKFIKVVLPPCLTTIPPLRYSGLCVSEWISRAARETDDALLVSEWGCHHVIESLPWRDRYHMNVAQAITVFGHDPVRCTSFILVPMQALLIDFDLDVVVKNVLGRRRKRQDSLLQIYEAVFQCPRRLPQTEALFRRLFCV